MQAPIDTLSDTMIEALTFDLRKLYVDDGRERQGCGREKIHGG